VKPKDIFNQKVNQKIVELHKKRKWL